MMWFQEILPQSRRRSCKDLGCQTKKDDRTDQLTKIERVHGVEIVSVDHDPRDINHLKPDSLRRMPLAKINQE